MNIAPRPKTHRITSDVHEHLLEAFHHTITEFFCKRAHGGQTPAQRRSAPVIETAVSIRSCSSSMLPRAAPNLRRPTPNFSRAWYNGTDYRFDLTALRALDNDLAEHCLAVLRLDHRPAVEVHGYFAGGEQRWQQIIACWILDKRPELEPAPVLGERYQTRYVTNQEAPGYRDITLMVPAA